MRALKFDRMLKLYLEEKHSVLIARKEYERESEVLKEAIGDRRNLSKEIVERDRRIREWREEEENWKRQKEEWENEKMEIEGEKKPAYTGEVVFLYHFNG